MEDAGTGAMRAETEEILPLVEETATVHMCEVVIGKVRIHTVTDAIEELAKTSLRSEAAEVARVPIDRAADVAPAVRTEDDVVIIPVLEEVLAVQMQLVLKEALHIRRVETAAVEMPVS